MAADPRLQLLEGAHRSLETDVRIMSERLEDVREAVERLDSKLDGLVDKIDSAAMARATASNAAEAGVKAIDVRLLAIETTKAQVVSGMSWVVSRAGPVFLAIVGASALSEPVKAAFAALFGP